jgi:tetratricopeptide (TPR) repeat protein
VADRHSVELTVDDTDLSRFGAALTTTAEHGHEPADVCSECIRPLNEATNLYRGDFLEGFSVRDAPEFEDWERTVTEGLRLQAGEAFHRLGMALAAAGDYPRAIAAITRWVELDELHEPSHRLLMLLNAWAGDRPGAVEAYRNFVAILDHELGVPPLDETTELYEAILDEDLPPAPGLRRRIKAATPITSKSNDLLNRQDEMDALRNALGSIDSQGHVVSLNGNAWMGKTRLLEELASETSDRGHGVVIGRSFRMEQGLPYGVITQILRSGGTRIKASEGEIPPWALLEASRLDPSLASGRPPTDFDRFGELRLFEALHEILSVLSRSQPLLLIADDVQWMDPASASLLSYLGHRISELPMLMLLAHRAGDPLPEAISDVVGSAQVVELRPLTADDLKEIVEEPDQAKEIISQTGGVPLLALEAIAADGAENDLSGVERYMESRLRDASELGKQVLATAAVLTGVCDASLLKRTSGRSEEEVVEAVEQLTAIGLLRELPEGEGLSFTLDSLEKLSYDSLSLIRRRLLHRRAGEALAERPRSSADPLLAAGVAAQFRGAGDPRAADWYRVAGDLARGVYANAEAQSFYEAAIALGSVAVGELRLGVGDLAMTRGDYTTAIQELTAAAAQSDGELLGIIEHRLGDANRLLGRFDMAAEHFQRSAETHPEPAGLYADWALLEQRMGNTENAFAMAGKARAAADESADDLARSRVLNVSGIVADDPAVAMQYLDEALQLAGDDGLARMAVLNNRAHLLLQIGNGDGAVRLIAEAIEIASNTGHRHREAALHNHLADLHHVAGRESEAEKAMTEAVALFADIDAGEWEPELWLLSKW